MTDTVRVRFAPAPTGYMHIGNLHTALFNWLFARNQGGQFVLRIEDTDEVRSTPEALQVIYDSLRWLSLDWDEGPDIGGPLAPYVQSERLEVYQAYLDRLVEQGQAYECYCTPEELEERRQILRAKGQAPRYDNRCRDLTEGERAAFREEARPACLRFKMAQTGTTVINDLIQGQVSLDNALVGDPVVGKTSGYPTYHFAVVVDDYLMQISHVIRAVEHLGNTQIHLQLQEALDFPSPQFAHLPLVLGEDRSKLSKRHGAVSVVEYAEKGYLPEAMFNFLALLGWSPGGAEEILPREAIIQRFSLEGCSASPSVFDLKKAEWLNSEYMKHMPGEELATRLLPLLQEHGLMAADPSPERLAWLAQVADLMKERTPLLTTFVDWAKYFFTDQYEYDEKARQKWLTKSTTPPILLKLADRLEALKSWEADSIEQAIRGLAEEREVGAGQVIHPCRAAVTGTTVGPSLFHLLELLDQQDVVNRLRRTAEAFTGE